MREIWYNMCIEAGGSVRLNALGWMSKATLDAIGKAGEIVVLPLDVAKSSPSKDSTMSLGHSTHTAKRMNLLTRSTSCSARTSASSNRCDCSSATASHFSKRYSYVLM